MSEEDSIVGWEIKKTNDYIEWQFFGTSQKWPSIRKEKDDRRILLFEELKDDDDAKDGIAKVRRVKGDTESPKSFD